MSARATASTDSVCLLLADLSGYTAYVAGSEPDHAPRMAGDLVEAVVKQLRPAFRLEKLEGDAAFLLAPLADLTGQTLLDAIDAAYDAFSRRVESLRQSTTCNCASCSRVPDLDLKFVVHAGEVVRHRIAGREEIGGRDGIVAHRLLKAQSPAQLGLMRYALFTDACLDALAIDADTIGARSAVEAFEYLGEVPVHLVELGGQAARQPWEPPARRQPLAEVEVDLFATPMTVWDELTSPERRPAWEGAIEFAEITSGGRRGVGTMTSCVANRLSSVEEILEWRPFEAFVRRATIDGVGRLTAQHMLSAGDGGASTRLRVRWFGPRTTAAAASVQRERLDTLARQLEGAHANR